MLGLEEGATIDDMKFSVVFKVRFQASKGAQSGLIGNESSEPRSLEGKCTRESLY